MSEAVVAVAALSISAGSTGAGDPRRLPNTNAATPTAAVINHAQPLKGSLLGRGANSGSIVIRSSAIGHRQTQPPSPIRDGKTVITPATEPGRVLKIHPHITAHMCAIQRGK